MIISIKLIWTVITISIFMMWIVYENMGDQLGSRKAKVMVEPGLVFPLEDLLRLGIFIFQTK